VPGGQLTIVLSIAARGGLDLPSLDEFGERQRLARRWSRFGVELGVVTRPDADQLAATGSTWARRLAAGRDRSAWRLELRRDPGVEAPIVPDDAMAAAR